MPSVQSAPVTASSRWRIASSVARIASAGAGRAGRPRSSPSRRCARTASRRSSARRSARTPTARPAASRWSVPSVRSRLVSAKSRSKWRMSSAPASAVSWCTITSGSAARDRRGDLLGVERVGHHRRRARAARRVLLGRAAGHADHLVAGRDQPRDQLLADRARCTCEKDLHFGSLRRFSMFDETAGVPVTAVYSRSRRRLRGRRRGLGCASVLLSERSSRSAPARRLAPCPR